MKLSQATLINTGLAVVVVGGIVAALVVTQPFSSTATQGTTQLTGTVQQGAVTSTITASGSVAAVREVAASFASSGTIATVDVALGQTVEAGQQLGTLDTADLSAAVSAAYTTLSRAKSDLASATTSLAEAKASAGSAATAAADPAASAGGTSPSGSTNISAGTSSGTSVSQAQSSVNSASDKVTDAATAATAAETALANATLTAPISGLVVAVNGSVGASTGSGASASGAVSSAGASTSATTSTSSFVTIADVSQYTMSASIAEADIASVTVGQTADISFPALEDVTTTATVTAIAPTATASNSVVTFATTLTLDSVPDGLRIGQTASATITTVSSDQNSLYVPTAAITTATDGTSTVDVVGDDDEVTTVTVELGVVGDQGTEIVAGLEVGQTVVLGIVTPTDSSDSGSTQMNGGFGGQMPTGGFPSGDMPSGGGFPSP